ncbi:MAG: MmcQ/YjbR family DNA-binding protein [Sphingomonas sp.]
MSPDPEADLSRIRQICMALPAAAEKVSHGAPTFFIEKGKVFAYFSHDHHGDGRTAVQVKTSGFDEQAMLVEADPGLYYVPPYIGPSGWVGMRLDTGDTDWEHVADRIARSWRLVAPPRLLAAR